MLSTTMLSQLLYVLLLLRIWSFQSVAASSSTQKVGTNIPFVSLGDLADSWNRRVEKAKELAALEQSVDDFNAQWIASCSSAGQAASYRRLIAMPLTDMFDPPVGMFSHGHVQTGDKMSLPKIFGDAVRLNNAEVPYLFQVSRVEGVTRSPRVHFELEQPEDAQEDDDDEDDDATKSQSKKKKKKKPKGYRPTDLGAAPPAEPLDAVVGSVLDLRAPANYIFLPWWMMRALGLRPRDVVDVKQVTNVPGGSMIKFRPLTEKMIKDISNPQAVFETELRHYSSMTAGSTIAFDYNKKRYWFEVAECRGAPRGEKKPMVKVQDCDVATDYLPARDRVNAARKKKQRRSSSEQDDKDE